MYEFTTVVLMVDPYFRLSKTVNFNMSPTGNARQTAR